MERSNSLAYIANNVRLLDPSYQTRQSKNKNQEDPDIPDVQNEKEDESESDEESIDDENDGELDENTDEYIK